MLITGSSGAYTGGIVRASICLFLSLLSLAAQAPPKQELFPIPTNMQDTFRGSGLGESDQALLEKAIQADLSYFERICDKKPPIDSLAMTSVALGKLGKGVLVIGDNSCMCGATGNCAIYIYVLEKTAYRNVLGGRRGAPGWPWGWAFAVANSDRAIPDLVFASNLSAGQNDLALYRYVGDRFLQQSCEALTPKVDGSPKSWWDPSEVDVRPCREK